MNKFHKEYRVAKNYESQTPVIEEQLKGVQPPVFLRVNPDAKISLSYGDGIDFKSCLQRYNAFHSSSYSNTRKRLISRLFDYYSSIYQIHDGYQRAPKQISPKTLTIQSGYNDALAAREKEVNELNRKKENVTLKKYKPKPKSPSFLISRKVVEEDLMGEAIARFTKIGGSIPSMQKIQSFVNEHIEEVLAQERRHAEELSDYYRMVEESLAISINAEYQKEYDNKIQEIEEEIKDLYRKDLTIDGFYDKELKAFGNYLDTMFQDIKSPYPMDIEVDYNQSTATAIVNIAFPDIESCSLPARIAKMAGREIQVYEIPDSDIPVEYAKSISGMAYYIAASLLDNNYYLSTVILSGTDKSKKNGLFASVFMRPDFKNLNQSDNSIESTMSRFIIVADYQGDIFAFNPIPRTLFRAQLNALIQESEAGKKFSNTISIPLAHAQTLVKQLHSAEDVEKAIAEAVKNNISNIRIDGKYASILRELGLHTVVSSDTGRNSNPGGELSLVGASDITTELATSTAVEHFLEWKDKRKDVLDMRGVTVLDSGQIRMTQRFVTTRYSADLLNKFNSNAWRDDYVFISKFRLAELEAAHLPEEYTNYLIEFSERRIEKAEEYEMEGKQSRAVKEYEKCLEYGCPVESPFDNLVRLYCQMGDKDNVKRIKELKLKTW